MAWRDPTQPQQGSDTELLAIAGAHQQSKLFVLCGDRFESSKLLRSGEFSARSIRLAGRSVAMATCKVGDHEWMLAKDSMAVRIAERAFVFALPGVLYGLCVSRESSGDVFRKLEGILASFCAYQDLVGRNGSDSPHDESEIWTRAYDNLKNLAAQSSTKLTAAAAASVVKSPFSGVGGGCCTIFDIVETKIQRAVRMSAAVKLTSRALLSGALLPRDHLQVAFPPPAATALPTVWTLAALLDAIESGGSSAAAAAVPRGRKVGFWWLRKEGVELLIEAVRAYGVAARKKPKLDGVMKSESAFEDGGEMGVSRGSERWRQRRSWRCMEY
ncbi:uncharacterized protein LOC110024111 [Phalaenopsis equestris]|uniref:uncharacterized protein LOC110024111 n=1 Tax=Phalaenopsis equestris TaxID=78828 RepID=UPI0009E61E1C|nr:uncharacterized protein LOC110024111 [Phalaenopsis equestris]